MLETFPIHTKIVKRKKYSILMQMSQVTANRLLIITLQSERQIVALITTHTIQNTILLGLLLIL